MSDYSVSDNEVLDKDETDTRQSRSTSESLRSGSSSSKNSNSSYTVSDYYELTLPLINGRCLQSSNVHSFLRTLLDFSLLHSFQLKALQKREIKLADLSLHEFKGGLQGLLIKSVLPKTTQIQYTARLRHKLVELCPIFILAMYMFARFHIPDTYGEYDLTEDSLSQEQFLDYKLLNGGNKLRPLSYSQQYKASTKILKINDKFKPIHLGKILTSQYNTDPDLGLVSENTINLKCSSHSVDNIQSTTGTSKNGCGKIFPFLNSHTYGRNPDFDKLFRLLEFVRRALVQDMVEVKKRFPENLVCEHAIFSSQEFCDFAGISREQSEGFNRKTIDSSPESSYASSVDYDKLENNSIKDGEIPNNVIPRKRLASREPNSDGRKRIKHLERMVDQMQKSQESMAREMTQFIESQSAQIAEQSNTLKKLMSSTDGLSILLATRNPNTTAYTKQILDQNNAHLSHLNRQLAQSNSDGLSISSKWNSRLQQIGAQSNQYHEKYGETRSRVLMSTPAVEVESIEELFSNFALWHRSLADHNISLDEWAAAHNANDRSLLDTRNALVRYLENEAARRQVPVQVVIGKLQSKIQDQKLSLVLPDLGRQLLAGGTIMLD
ncbi:hypothetical protein CXQ85_001682 [Candidozyma haemuli]|uniref:Ndc10 domain-containing protein n=1 Tax=Candidozyma haemuli TaxID=45357 RepID=A0A2V1AQ42_9ASCO|nr:hypothetical protein CXQ85_001682 [[Candida] haemuloni]PVH19905.1 hypothetical protein CXQ85_001682 [[Candida] haemuloni]